MPVIGFAGALLAALGWGTDAVLARQGLRRMPPALGTFLSLCAGLTACLILLAIVGPARYPLAGVAWFMLVGLVNFLLGRQCNYRATKQLGAARAASIFATSPLVSITLAILFAGEHVSIPLLLGVALVISGIILVVRS
jgi:O-acetylserine/cysteine efflux transporter